MYPNLDTKKAATWTTSWEIMKMKKVIQDGISITWRAERKLKESKKHPISWMLCKFLMTEVTNACKDHCQTMFISSFD